MKNYFFFILFLTTASLQSAEITTSKPCNLKIQNRTEKLTNEPSDKNHLRYLKLFQSASTSELTEDQQQELKNHYVKYEETFKAPLAKQLDIITEKTIQDYPTYKKRIDRIQCNKSLLVQRQQQLEKITNTITTLGVDQAQLLDNAKTETDTNKKHDFMQQVLALQEQEASVELQRQNHIALTRFIERAQSALQEKAAAQLDELKTQLDQTKQALQHQESSLSSFEEQFATETSQHRLIPLQVRINQSKSTIKELKRQKQNLKELIAEMEDKK